MLQQSTWINRARFVRRMARRLEVAKCVLLAGWPILCVYFTGFPRRGASALLDPLYLASIFSIPQFHNFTNSSAGNFLRWHPCTFLFLGTNPNALTGAVLCSANS